MLARLREGGKAIIGIGFALGMLALVVAIFLGAAALGEFALPFLAKLVGVLFFVAIPLLSIAAILPLTRPAAAKGFVRCSEVFAVTLWLWALLYVLVTWGWVAVILGIFLGGVGVVPIAILSSITHGEWAAFGQTVLALAVTFGTRLVGLWLAIKVARPPATHAGMEVVP